MESSLSCYFEGKKNGRGKLTFADGSIYEGDFQMNEISGEGTYLWSDGKKY